MINLIIPCETDHPSRDPFVVKLASGRSNVALCNRTAILAGESDSRLLFQIDECMFVLPKASADNYDGDVVLIDPRRQQAHRWIRGSSAHNTLLVTEQCDQLCVMCSQPPRKTHVDLFDNFLTACRLTPQGATIGFSGGEPTLHKQALFRILDQLHQDRPDLSFHVLTNAQHFEQSDRATLRALKSVCWGVPLYSATPERHDDIVRKKGAFHRLQQGLDLLGGAGAQIELRTVVMRRNALDLPDLADHLVATQSLIQIWAIMQLECTGYAKNRWTDLFYDHSEDFGPIAEACAIAMLHDLSVALYNFPYCTVPPPWRPLAVASISDWKRRFDPSCDSCRKKDACAGFFEWHPTPHGYRNLEAL